MMSDFFESFLTPLPPLIRFFPSIIRFFGVILDPPPCPPKNRTPLCKYPPLVYVSNNLSTFEYEAHESHAITGNENDVFFLKIFVKSK